LKQAFTFIIPLTLAAALPWHAHSETVTKLDVGAAVALGSADGSTFGCHHRASLSVLSDAIAGGDGETIYRLTFETNDCYPIWAGSRGLVIEFDGSDEVLVFINRMEKFPDSNQPKLWTFASSLELVG